MNLTKKIKVAASFTSLCVLMGCGGGSSDSGILIEGTLSQGSGVVHSASLKHSEGAKIESVEICALGECSTTDSNGQWGLVAPEDFTGGDVLFSIIGHGINATTTVTIPNVGSDVSIEFVHSSGSVNADHITINGETSHHEENSH